MSGAKETPRQKMIGMMYLVYTALLAMNVSADILDAFAIVNDGQEKTNASIEIKINDQYSTFQDQYNKEQAKIQLYWDKALAIREKTDEIVNYIEKDLMVPMLLQTEGIKLDELMNPKDPKKAILKNRDNISQNDNRTIYEFELSNVSSKDNYDTPMTFMVTQGNASVLKQKIEDYRAFIVSTMEDVGIKNYSQHIGLYTDTDKNGEKMEYKDKDGKPTDWEHKHFSHIVFVAQMAILNKYVGEIQTTEYDAVGTLMNKIGASDYKFNKLQARVIAKSDYITQGQDYEAEVFLVASDTMRNFDAKYAMGVDNFSKFSGTPTVVKSEGGIVKLKIPAKNIGQQKYAGVIEMISPETGETEYHPFEASYIVSAPTATVAPTKMMIMYKELKNPISVSAPGVASEDLIVTVEGGKLSNDKGAGNYFVEVNDNASIVKVKVSTKEDNKVVSLRTEEFRVKPVPNPEVKIGGYIIGGRIDKEELVSTGRIAAAMRDFDFEGYNYTVDSYTVSTYRGNPIEKKNNGARFTSEVMELITSARSGQRITFQDIMVKSPKGELRNMGSISVSIK